jgi:hypothetical protein
LAGVKCQSIAVRLKCNGGTGRKIKDVPRFRFDLVACLIGNPKHALDNDLHLVVCVLVDKRRALFETVKACADGLFWVQVLRGGDVTEIGVLVGDERGFVSLLPLGQVGHGKWRRHDFLRWLGRGSGVDFAKKSAHISVCNWKRTFFVLVGTSLEMILELVAKLERANLITG